MKNKIVSIMTKIIVILIIVAIAVFAFFIYSNAKEESNNNTDKIEEEIDYLDTKITSLINYFNGINLENYKISISKIQEEEASGTGETNEEDSKKAEEQEKQEGDVSNKETTITKMEQQLTVNQNQDINWEWLQSETEVVYSVWATIVLDLYDIGVDGTKIVDFSKALDNTLIDIKSKEKEKTCMDLAKLYEFLPEFIKKTEIQDLKKKVIESKKHIINAYAYIQKEDWAKVEEEILNSEKVFIQVINDISKKEDQRKFNINKTYILVEELKNSIPTKDSGIFYIKYKNLLEELNTLI